MIQRKWSERGRPRGATPAPPDGTHARTPARGFSLVEILIVVTVMGILISMSVPSFQRAIETARADMASAQLRAVWSAQRLYWLENRTYASDLGTLRSAGLLDAGQPSTSGHYSYDVAVGGTGSFASSFVATATRNSGSSWSGAFSIAQDGTISGSIISNWDMVSPGTPYTIHPSYP